VNTIANKIVINNPIIAPLRSPLIRAWCAQVTKAPLDNNNIVFNKGIAKGSKDSIPTGGHTAPISIVGAKAEWKKAQNTDMNAITSLKTNKINPKDKPDCTWLVWCPKYVASNTTSLNHKTIIPTVKINPNSNR
jgi:hypothetical protein